MKLRILLIGQGLFIDGLTRILNVRENAIIIGEANTLEAARALLNQEQPNILIVDHTDEKLRSADLDPLLESGPESLKVVYLTLTENKMVIHDRQQLSDVSLPDLIQALQLPGLEGESQP